MHLGSVVRFRNRDWVVVPSLQQEHLALRPLTGTTDDVVVVHRHLCTLVGGSLPTERPTPSSFPLPDPTAPEAIADAQSAYLLWQAARLTLREGAWPLRSLGRISIRPRLYQFVPLLMALRLDPVRLLIADDVGVGKTIEALLIARELWDRGEIRRLCVLCPPYLCDQWQEELTHKFHLEAVVVRSGTIGQLERAKPANCTLYEHYPVQVISIDWAKSERNRHLFLLHCPELVIVDEAHGAAPANPQAQQERHALVKKLAEDAGRHLLLLTATPHSGLPDTFCALLSLLQPKFGTWEVATLNEAQRAELARHFIQRTRADVVRDWEGEPCFPRRELRDETYPLSPAYQDLFWRTYEFCSEMVQTGQTLAERQRRVRHWAALALLRCVMSSPAAALAALEARQKQPIENEADGDFGSLVFEAGEERPDDEQPTPPIQALEQRERRQLRQLAELARRVQAQGQDTKVTGCGRLVRTLLQDGLYPIVWCRYVATAEYVADYLQRELPGVQVVCVTGRQGDEERKEKIKAIDGQAPRVLVATDCLSEGINLQEKFTAAIHYDLPWNPNRLEQREGRVDRYGQTAPRVVTIRYFSPDNPVDGVVLEVLLNKAREIRRALGTSVPVPQASESVMEAVLQALFLRGARGQAPQQLTLDLDFGEAERRTVARLHRQWDEAAEREKVTRTRFAQRAIKVEEVRRELEAVDAVLGDPEAVREFVLAAAQRLGLEVQPVKGPVYAVATSAAALAAVPDPIRQAIPAHKGDRWPISFVSPTPEGAEYLGRNHPFVASLARFLMEEALGQPGRARAKRCGVIRTRAVTRLTTLLLLRVRYLVQIPKQRPLLSEEMRVYGYTAGEQGKAQWLDDGEALRLLSEARPDANVPLAEKQELAAAALEQWPQLEPQIHPRIAARGEALAEAHKRIRQAVRLRIQELAIVPQLPPDLVGLLVLQPMVEGG